MKAHYPSDAEMLEKMPADQLADFSTWMADLERIMEEWASNYDGGIKPFGGATLSEITGLACWKECFDAGMTAHEAFNDGEIYWK